jgi:predicted dinucleotide-binding enzyme
MKNIGIIGAGQIGSALAKKFSVLGHNVKIANSRGPVTIDVLAKGIGASAVSIYEAVQDADMVVIAIPQKSIENLPMDLFENAPKRLIIVDTGNYYPLRDGTIEALDAGLPESEWVAAHLKRPVLKAFNSIGVHPLADDGKPKGDPERIALPVSGDDENAKEEIIKLFDALGFDGVDAGPLSESWRQQPGSPVYCTNHSKEELIRLLQLADISRLGEMRDTGLELVMKAKEPFKEAQSILRNLYPI